MIPRDFLATVPPGADAHQARQHEGVGMTQTRRGSATETAVSTSVGFAVSWAATLVVLPAFGFPSTHSQAFVITCIYTVLSLVRGYVVRRAFNRLARSRA